ncbi:MULTISPECIES: RNase A-like domain-containing protein [unclassified Lysinibacillus]|uniref:RNase A-like domain-containing protein n=1 Tax=unclassified Lysinibacillus TaxID=2636778 RepID=UPI0038111C9F
MVRSIPGPSKKISTYGIDTNKMTKVMRNIALEKKSNSNTSNSSKGSKQNPKQVITKSKSALENGVRSQITNRQSNSISNNPTNIRSDTDYQIFYSVDSSSLGSSVITLNNLNSMDGVRTASLDTVEISGKSRELFVAKSSKDKYLDIAGTVFDIVTDFIPGVGTAKDIYNVYKTIVDPKSKVADIALALVDLVPGPSVSKLKKFADVIIDKFSLNKSTAKKLTDALVKTSAAKIRKMDIDDTKRLINASEGKGRGHTKDKHLNITDETLQYRSKTDARDGASRFSSPKVMNEFVNNVLDKEADKIASWLKSSNNKDFVSGKHKSTTSLGDGYIYDAKKKTYKHVDKLDTGKVVLRKDNSNEYGFIVYTSYPIVKK